MVVSFDVLLLYVECDEFFVEEVGYCEVIDGLCKSDVNYVVVYYLGVVEEVDFDCL